MIKINMFQRWFIKNKLLKACAYAVLAYTVVCRTWCIGIKWFMDGFVPYIVMPLIMLLALAAVGAIVSVGIVDAINGGYIVAENSAPYK